MAATDKQVSASLTPNQYWAALRPYLPSFSVEEQRAAVALYRELAKGEPVDDAQLAGTLGLSIIETRAFLERETIKCLAYPDDQGRVLGFGGLAATAMHHRFRGGRPRALDMVRLGQPVHPRNPGPRLGLAEMLTIRSAIR
jgi:hypothetical protein